jgi:putative peptide zinc metalloprotease protein
MQVLRITRDNHEIVLDISPWNGTEKLLVDNQLVSQKTNTGLHSVHDVVVENLGLLRLLFTLNLSAKEISYQCWINDQLIAEGVEVIAAAPEANLLQGESALQTENLLQEKGAAISAQPKPRNIWPLLAIGFKLVKSIQVLKVALLAASVGAYSLIFSVEFALALIAVLVFHEYGHLRAMKKFGIPTKGMYLIPFVGGLAVGDAPRTRWQDIYISMMGPVYGLIMTLAFYIFYLVTGSHFAGLVASISGLINLFNLIPVHPLDGGRVVKSLVFSGRNYWAFLGLLVVSAVCLVAALQLGLAFLVFFIVLGVLDIITSWRISLAEDITPLTPYGITFCLLWYLLTIVMFIGMILLIAGDGLPGSEIALKVLSN